MTASQHSNGLQWSEVYKQCENKKCTKIMEMRKMMARTHNHNNNKNTEKKSVQEETSQRDTYIQHHIKISLLIVHWGHALNNMLEITINDGQETRYTLSQRCNARRMPCNAMPCHAMPYHTMQTNWNDIKTLTLLCTWFGLMLMLLFVLGRFLFDFFVYSPQSLGA